MSKPPARSGTTRDRTRAYRRLAGNVLLSEADVELLNALKPRCWVCDNPVRGMFWGRKSIMDMSLTFTIECHGETEEAVITLDNIPALLSGGVQGAVAFEKKPEEPK